MQTVMLKDRNLSAKVSKYAKDRVGRVLAEYIPMTKQYIVYTDMVAGVLCGEISLNSNEVYYDSILME